MGFFAVTSFGHAITFFLKVITQHGHQRRFVFDYQYNWFSYS